MNDNIMLVAINGTSMKHTKATKNTRAKLDWMIDYLAKNPKSINRIHASDMQLWIPSEASCLTVSKAKSRVADFHFSVMHYTKTCHYLSKIHHSTHQCIWK